MGTGTTLLASARCGRKAIGVEIEPAYVLVAKGRIERDLKVLFGTATPAYFRHEAAPPLAPAVAGRHPGRRAAKLQLIAWSGKHI